MARKTPVKPVPPEQSPEYLALVAALPDDRDALDDKARELLSVRHDAMLAADDTALARADFLYDAIVIKLNGGTNFGAKVESDRLRALFAATPGQVPSWGRMGEFLLEVDGLRLVVEFKPYALHGHFELAVQAVDRHKPFISRTGYTHRYVVVAAHLGRSVTEAARVEVLKLRTESGLVPIDQAYEGAAPVAVRWPWLARVMASASPDGQLAMFGDASVAKQPMSNAERQKALRKRRKEQQLKPVMLTEAERQQLEQWREQGAGQDEEHSRSILLTHTERCVLSLGLLAHEDLDHRPADWETSKKPGFDALLLKLWPEGDNGRYLAEPERSTRRPAGRLRERIAGLERQVAGLQKNNALEIADRAKAFEAVETLTERLRKAGLCTDYRKQPGE